MKKTLICLVLLSGLYFVSCTKAGNPKEETPHDPPPPPPPPPPVTYVHGSLRSVVAAGSGTKVDNNAANYTFAGHRHMHYRFTDFEAATTPTPTANTKEGWLAHTSGLFPIKTSDDFNDQATASGVTLEMTGGPTPSGKFARRHNNAEITALFPANSRLRNWNVFPNVGVKSYLHFAFYLKASDAQNTGKFVRFYWRRADLPTTDPKYTTNFWMGKPPFETYAWRAEYNGDGYTPGYGDQPFEIEGKWNRVELLFDFANDTYQMVINGTTLTDVSKGYVSGIVSGQLGSNCTLTYGLLGNTVEPMLPNQFIGWAQPYVDFSPKRIELADNANWSLKTKSVTQPVKSWASDNVEFIVNQGDFTDLTNKHIFYVNGTTATYLGTLY